MLCQCLYQGYVNLINSTAAFLCLILLLEKELFFVCAPINLYQKQAAGWIWPVAVVCRPLITTVLFKGHYFHSISFLRQFITLLSITVQWLCVVSRMDMVIYILLVRKRKTDVLWVWRVQVRCWDPQQNVFPLLRKITFYIRWNIYILWNYERIHPENHLCSELFGVSSLIAFSVFFSDFWPIQVFYFKLILITVYYFQKLFIYLNFPNFPILCPIVFLIA